MTYLRLLENGNRRVTEALDVRITEGLRDGSVSLSAGGSAIVFGGKISAGRRVIENDTGPITKTVTSQTVGSANKYFIDGVQQDTLALVEGTTYVFNYPANHPFRFSTTPNGTHAAGSEYTTGVTHNSSTQTTIIVASGAPTLYYYCSSHSGMGGTANTPAPVVSVRITEDSNPRETEGNREGSVSLSAGGSTLFVGGMITAGRRVAENGDIRITENSQNRETEGNREGHTTFSTVSSMVVTSYPWVNGIRETEDHNTRITENNVARASEGHYGDNSLSLSAVASMSVDATTVRHDTSITFSANSSALFKGLAGRVGNGTLSAVSSISATVSSLTKQGSSQISSDATSLTALVTAITKQGKIDTDDGVRVLENGSRRITEDGLVRVTRSPDVMAASLHADSTRVIWNGQTSVYVGTTWKVPITYINDNSSWKVVTSGYYFETNKWKRIV